MNKRIAQKISETIAMLEANGRTVHRVVLDGKKVEFILTAQDDAPPKIEWD